MQTQALPIQVSGASASPAPKNANAGASADGAQFSHALTREMAQRQHNPAPAPAPAPAAKQPAPAAPPAAPAPAAKGAQAPAKPAGDKADASTDKADDDASDAVAAATVPTMADMLALVASFNPPVQKAAPATTPAADPLTPAAKGLIEVAIDTAPALPTDMASGGETSQGEHGHAGKQPADLKLGADGRAAAAFKLAAQGADAGAPAASGEAPATPVPAAGAVQFAQAFAREGKAEPVAIKDAPLPAALVAPPVLAPIQQASLAITHAAGAPNDAIGARVGTPGWDNQVGQKIVWMVAGGEQSASLTLNPPDMGPMQVVLSVNNDQATVTFTSAQPEVRQALENAMPKLREMLGESGIALGNATVNAGTPEQRQPQQGEQSRGGGGGTRFGAGAGEVAVEQSLPRTAGSSGGIGLVDTFA